MAVVHSGVRDDIKINEIEKTNIETFIECSRNATMMFFLNWDQIPQIQEKCRYRSVIHINEVNREKLRALSVETVVLVT